MEQKYKIRNKRFKDSLVLVTLLFGLFLLTSWYSQLDKKKEIVIKYEGTIPYSKLIDPDFDKYYFHKKILILNKKKTMIPFIATYDTLVVKDMGIYSRYNR